MDQVLMNHIDLSNRQIQQVIDVIDVEVREVGEVEVVRLSVILLHMTLERRYLHR
jgi:hypothetical protein